MSKYKIGQSVTIDFYHGVHVMKIFEINETTCTAGTQTFYRGRVNGVDENGRLYHTPKEILIREEEITGISKQEDVWEELARQREKKDKKNENRLE